ncbi:glutamyl-tRNA(Gln) amidotransferase subunit C, mitochondrial-like [Mercenaria mercenaria]|uniref:glutamyl-tRNA(Gln) amidotransferase subunit C, mitochondrial-like n=1 Tax=Mercenaria mercenaria TaxID=6596 RepID=UPI00234EF030|nr:glutamyl-tRNA(Gln) amidotransferase subunit C, mitochondrial-like [Mercenaria mercenaria]
MALHMILRGLKVKRTYCVHVAQRVCLLSSKIPDKPQWKEINPKDLPPVPEITDEMINHLERLSLVEFNNKAGVERLRSAIEYANQLYMVDTEGVEPMYSVLEDRELLLREDVVTEGDCKNSILQNAVKVDEDYFVAPPGNIPLNQEETKTFQKNDT